MSDSGGGEGAGEAGTEAGAVSGAEHHDRVRAEYDRAAVATPEFSLMNYGYAPAGEPPPVAERDPEHFCLEMYRRIADADLTGKEVVEVSCGRGGGAAFVMATFRPRRLVAVDLSDKNLELARRRFGHLEGLELRQGVAEALDLPDAAFDAVLNVEASHLYDAPGRFFAEVRRVLRPGGRFLYADLFWPDGEPERLLAEAGLEVVVEEDVTAHVLRALEFDRERREGIMRSSLPEAAWQAFRDWSGIPGHRAYNRFASGEWRYRRFVAQRP